MGLNYNPLKIKKNISKMILKIKKNISKMILI